RVWTALVPTLDGAEDGGSPVFHNEMTDKPDDADAERHGYRPGAYHGQPRPPGIFVFAHGARQSSRISRSGSRGRPQLTAVWAASTFNSQTRRSMRALRTSGSSAMPKAMPQAAGRRAFRACASDANRARGRSARPARQPSLNPPHGPASATRVGIPESSRPWRASSPRGPRRRTL